MARTIYLDDFDNVSNIMFHSCSEQVQEGISNKFKNYIASVRDTKDNFINGLINRYQKDVNDRALNIGDLMKQKVGSIFQTNTIRGLNTIAEIQSAPTVMRKWVMTNPTLRERYAVKGISGYNGNFENRFPDQGSGESHYDYRRVMDGVIHKDTSNKLVSIQYIESLAAGNILTISEKAIIRQVWCVTNQHIKNGGSEDPTDEFDELF